jgi:hypothetical protein
MCVCVCARVWLCVCVCDLRTPRERWPRPDLGCCATNKNDSKHAAVCALSVSTSNSQHCITVLAVPPNMPPSYDYRCFQCAYRNGNKVSVSYGEFKHFWVGRGSGDIRISRLTLYSDLRIYHKLEQQFLQFKFVTCIERRLYTTYTTSVPTASRARSVSFGVNRLFCYGKQQVFIMRIIRNISALCYKRHNL